MPELSYNWKWNIYTRNKCQNSTKTAKKNAIYFSSIPNYNFKISDSLQRLCSSLECRIYKKKSPSVYSSLEKQTQPAGDLKNLYLLKQKRRWDVSLQNFFPCGFNKLGQNIWLWFLTELQTPCKGMCKSHCLTQTMKWR